MTTNAEFSDIVASLLGDFIDGSMTEATFETAFKIAIDEWTGAELTKAAIARQLTQILENVSLRENEVTAWWAGEADGGFYSDGVTPGGGYYPITDPAGVTTFRPCPARIASTVAKGDPGSNAAADLSGSFDLTYGANKFLAGHMCTFPVTFTTSKCKARCRGVPTSTAVVRILKNGSAWCTITFAAGQNTGNVAFSTAPSVIENDFLEVFAPTVADPTFSDFYFTLAGGYN